MLALASVRGGETVKSRSAQLKMLVNDRDAPQLLLGAPFLIDHPVAYLMRSFELGRVFQYKWTVNFKFLDEGTFVSPRLSVALLALTVLVLGCFAVKWLRARGPAAWGEAKPDVGKTGSKKLPAAYVVKTLFVSNFIGIVFCRSLHYQVGLVV